MTRVLVLGRGGMVGRAVVALLRTRDGAEVLTAGRDGAADRHVDAMDPAPLDDLVAGVDVVVNAVGVLRQHPAYGTDAYRLEATAVNAVFPLRLAEAAERSGARVVHVSTDAVFAAGGPPADEATPVGPAEPYAQSKVLGESSAEHVVNIRCSVIGPAPDRGSGLWSWLVGQPRDATVGGFVPGLWAGVTSGQLAWLCGDLLDAEAFGAVRGSGPLQHFVPNEAVTKHDVLTKLAQRVRPDVHVERREGPAGRLLVSATQALEAVYTGPRGWDAALAAAVAG